MTGLKVDIAVVGAGPVGLAAALVLARAGASVGLIGPEPPPGDGRTAALLAGSVDLLRSLGVWERLEPHSGPLRRMRLVDDTDSLFRPPPVCFEASEIGLEVFGWNVENRRLAEELEAVARHEPGLVRRTSTLVDCRLDEGGAALSLSDMLRIEAKLVIGADGRRSAVRTAAGLSARERRYPQSAFTTLLRHERDHHDTSTEFHTRAGPLTVVPMPGRASSLVWVTSPHHAARLRGAEPEELARAIELATRSLLGRVSVDGPRGTTPLVFVSVDSLVGRRVALAGEAGHVLPPIGAQGLNLGFADVVELGRVVGRAMRDGVDPGRPGVLALYNRRRSLDVRLRSAAVHGLNRALLTSFPLLDAARGLGLGLLGAVRPLRRAVMRLGLPGGRAATAREGAAPSRS